MAKEQGKRKSTRNKYEVEEQSKMDEYLHMKTQHIQNHKMNHMMDKESHKNQYNAIIIEDDNKIKVTRNMSDPTQINL